MAAAAVGLVVVVVAEAVKAVGDAAAHSVMAEWTVAMEVVAGAALGVLEERRWVVAHRRRSIRSCRGYGRSHTHHCTRSVRAVPEQHCKAGGPQFAMRPAAALDTRARAGPRDRCRISCHGTRASPAAGEEAVALAVLEAAVVKAVVAGWAEGVAAEVRMHHSRTSRRPSARTRAVFCTCSSRERKMRQASHTREMGSVAAPWGVRKLERGARPEDPHCIVERKLAGAPRAGPCLRCHNGRPMQHA